MRGFGALVSALALSLLGGGSIAERSDRARDALMLAYLRSERARGRLAHGARDRLEGLLDGLSAAKAPIPGEDEEIDGQLGRFFWEPLARLFPQGECWEWASAWAKTRGVPLREIGLSAVACFERGALLEGQGVGAGRRLARAALMLGLSETDRARAGGEELRPLGAALALGAWETARELSARGESWADCGLDASQAAHRAKEALWPELIESLASSGARLREDQEAPALDMSRAIEAARKAGRSAAEGDAVRCALALAQLGADPNRAPLRGRSRAFPLEGALLARAPALALALLGLGADPEEARVKGRLSRLLSNENPAAAPILAELSKRKEQRDERYALWGMYQRGELKGADGEALDLSARIQRARLARSQEKGLDEPAADPGEIPGRRR